MLYTHIAWQRGKKEGKRETDRQIKRKDRGRKRERKNKLISLSRPLPEASPPNTIMLKIGFGHMSKEEYILSTTGLK